MIEQHEHLTVEIGDDIVVVRFNGPRITNVNDIRQIGDVLFKLLENHYPAQFILDFERVNYLPSAMLGKLAAIRNKISSLGGRLKLTNLQGQVKQVFEMTQLEKIFAIFPDVDSALKEN